LNLVDEDMTDGEAEGMAEELIRAVNNTTSTVENNGKPKGSFTQSDNWHVSVGRTRG
jgi:hypothetical protein